MWVKSQIHFLTCDKNINLFTNSRTYNLILIYSKGCVLIAKSLRFTSLTISLLQEWREMTSKFSSIPVQMLFSDQFPMFCSFWVSYGLQYINFKNWLSCSSVLISLRPLLFLAKLLLPQDVKMILSFLFYWVLRVILSS